MRQNLEFQHQCALIQWASHNDKIRDYLIHIPNGGSRHKIEAVNLKRSGVKAGVPDIFMAIPRNGFGGLWIELKAPKSKTSKPKVSEKQDLYIELLNKAGYRAVVCWGWDEAREEILRYLA